MEEDTVTWQNSFTMTESLPWPSIAIAFLILAVAAIVGIVIWMVRQRHP